MTNVKFATSSQILSSDIEYEVCLKSNGTVHAARKTFIAEKKKHCFLWCHNVL